MLEKEQMSFINFPVNSSKKQQWISYSSIFLTDARLNSINFGNEDALTLIKQLKMKKG